MYFITTCITCAVVVADVNFILPLLVIGELKQFIFSKLSSELSSHPCIELIVSYLFVIVVKSGILNLNSVVKLPDIGVTSKVAYNVLSEPCFTIFVFFTNTFVVDAMFIKSELLTVIVGELSRPSIFVANIPWLNVTFPVLSIEKPTLVSPPGIEVPGVTPDA